MILALSIKNIALIEEAEIKFEDGLNILTGETGAGKSIVIDSMMLLLGGRANKDIIRNGTQKATVEGIFLINSHRDLIHNILDEAGIEYEEDDTLIISRDITENGRNYCRVNGRIVSLSFLNKLGTYLVDILGQHEHQFLLDNSKHMSILDNFQDKDFFRIKNMIKDLLEKYNSLNNKLKEFNLDDKEKISRIDLLKYQINEIESANIKPGEEDDLIEKRNILMNSEKLFNYMNESYNLLYKGIEDNTSIVDRLSTVLKNLDTSFRIDKKLEKLKDMVESVLYTLEDCSLQIRDYVENIDFNADNLNEIEKRLDLLNNLKRKYGRTIEEIIKYKEEKNDELLKLLNAEKEINKINEEKEKIMAKIKKLSDELHLKRRNVADFLEKKISTVLSELNMPNTIFKVDIRKKDVPNENGMDDVEFLISTNIGEPLKPLEKIASGGELSRIMLALKTILADFDGISTLIFDEVDTGISGKAAQAVAEKIALISRNHQVICVTHLPQITSMADAHYKITKEVNKDKTYIKIEKLNYEGKIKELSRIISGSIMTDTTYNHSKELIDLAQKYKNSIRQR
ncbi:DNA repair protein RecN [Thermoanaerobacterium thermosaccharolyticum DSM 571]|uniref:DNA repair protein RecN n=1 Tax=Thermoanaerobacterium thermosaccharolyticum (strain ATCC 7956 / DSM 571 / NCIMB 9385 / NCA 3814 / NCTC 13789 / WDCM 00135 / 2032) TaxID=580327 RepID=D9TQD1_THETC|nr:DNA repair protein RecN [Thermoanaerobacterium thermosaccharolyticum]ADL68832.1 DNA repair protein RecN [Thermoanaerobacterium thermosaccharolyticum DSM 571]